MTTGKCFTTFEHACFTNIHKSLYYYVLYRPPPSKDNGLKTADFLCEFDNYVDFINSLGRRSVLVGDFNLHINNPIKLDVVHFLTTLDIAGYHQHVTGATHKHGNTLDLIISRLDDDIIADCEVGPRLSDHHIIHCKLLQKRPKAEKTVVRKRILHKMDVKSFEADLSPQLIISEEHSDVNNLTSIYDKSIRDTLDKHAPEICSTRNYRLRQPWYDNTIHEARRERRKYERKWTKSRLECDHLLYAEQRNSVNDLIDKAKQDYFKGVFDQADTKTVFKEVNSLLNRNTTTLPAHESPQGLCNAFAEFFSEKVEKIYNTLEEKNGSCG